MITHSSYYNRLREAVDSGSVVAFQSALDEIRAHYLAFKAQEEAITRTEMNTAHAATLALVDVRSAEDYTILMYACARHRLFKQQGQAGKCQALDTLVAWLLEQGANLMAEGGRPIERTTGRDGRPTFKRGRGRNVVEALGMSWLPPSAQAKINAVDEFNEFERRNALRWYESDYSAAA